MSKESIIWDLLSGVQGDTLHQMAKQKRRQKTSAPIPPPKKPKHKKMAAAVALGKRRAELAEPGELAALSAQYAASGGVKRAAVLSAERRQEIARDAAAARWAKNKTPK